MISRVYRTIAKSAGVPIIGMGGIQFWTDAVEFLLAGASAVGVGTALFVDPAAPTKILQGIVDYMQKTGISHLQEIIGALQLPGDQPRSAPYP
jgi:dihydroorotate dehydrogenase (NAD+) catalytic subunit